MDDKKGMNIILVAVDDIFFASKIRGEAEALGISIILVRTTEKFFEKLKKEKPIKVIVDLHSENIDPFLIAETLKADPYDDSIKLIGFFSHVQTGLMKKAIDAGYDEVLPRSAFTKKLRQILEVSD